LLTLRSVVVMEVVLAAALIIGAAAPGGRSEAMTAREARQAVSLPGSGLLAMTDAQARWLATRIGEQVEQRSGGRAGLQEFLSTVREMRSTSSAWTARVFSGGRTLAEVLRELGGLMQAEQRLGRDGRCRRIAECVGRLRAARDAGAPEEQVQRLAREAAERGDLAVVPDEECSRVREEMCGLIAVLVEGSTNTGLFRP